MSDASPAADSPTSVPVADFVEGHEHPVVDSVRVRISLRIIERFSEGLYSSPSKTFEELVSNSYDAGAERVWVYLPPDFTAPEARIVVADDGESMDRAGLHDLWRIGESSKRDAPPVRGRLPVGKFGIGKLATYVLANELTYIVHTAGEYHAITMDYGRVRGSMEDPSSLELGVVALSRDEAIESIRHALEGTAVSEEAVIQRLFADEGTEPATWTIAVLSRLKPTAQRIQLGRLRWVLATALPLNPAFQLALSDQAVAPSKFSLEVQWNFTIGHSEKDETPTQLGTSTSVEVAGTEIAGWELPNAGVIYGSAQLYSGSLQRGKSEDWGRSHGFFVRVRQRLINLNDDATFEVGPELHHGTFTRFHMEINADGLDHLIASPRESLQESPELTELKGLHAGRVQPGARGLVGCG
jgi:hypothetical protein